MRTDKNLVVIGFSDEDTAHLRLLIRKAAEQLQQRWRWGTEAGADLVVVDPRAFAGQMARTRALAGGVRCAVYCEDAAEAGQELHLQRPFKVENVVDVLNRAGGIVLSLAPPIEAMREDYYFPVGAVASSKLDPPDIFSRVAEDKSPPLERARSSSADPSLGGIEEMIKLEMEAQSHYSVPLKLDDSTEIQRVSGSSRRGESRAGDNPDSLLSFEQAPGLNTLPQIRRGGAVDDTRHPLRAYLDDGLLGGPAQIAFPDTAALTLDPKHGVFYSDGSLAQLEPYVRDLLSRVDWRTLTTAEFAQIREGQTAQSYQHLVWLETLINSGGRLSSQLDPGGTYKLKHWIEIERDVRQHQRIARAMMHPARLNEIAATAGVPMEDVFDVVNAYHAIGLVEWESRASLRPPVKPAKEGSGLLSRLKRPFGKS